MRAKEDLFHLIKAMSKSEKRYFTLDAKKSGKEGAKYLELFQAINAMETYEEAKLKKKFPRNLSSDKGYLYEAIMRSMRDYRSTKSKAAQIRERLMDSKYLYERGLYNQSNDRLFEAKVVAKELEDQFALLEINKEEHLSRYASKGMNKGHWEYLEQINLERKAILKAVLEEIKYFDLYLKLSMEVSKEFNLKDESSKKELKERIPSGLLKEENKPKAPQAVRRYHLCNAMYYRLLGDTEKVYEHSKAVANWWDRFPSLKEEEFHRYVIDVSNLVNTCYKLNYFHEVQDWLNRIRLEKSGVSYHDQRIIFFTLSISNLLHLMNQSDFTSAKEMLPEIIAGLNKFGLKRSIVLTGNIVTVYFLAKDYENCIYWSDFIIKSLKSGDRKDINRLVRLYKLIATYELEKIDELEANLRAINRYFKKVNLPKDRFEQIVLSTHLKKIFNAPITEEKEAFQEFKTYLLSILENPELESPLGVDEFLIWTNQRLEDNNRS